MDDHAAFLRKELIDALTAGNVNATTALLRRFPVATDAVDDSRTAPLVLTAAGGGSVPCLRLLHDAGFNLFVLWTGAEVEADDPNGKGATTVLHCAASNGHLSALRYLLHDLPELEQEARVRMLDQQDVRWDTPVSCAAKGGHLQCVRHLAEVCGVNTSVNCSSGSSSWLGDMGTHRTAIHAALEGYLAEGFKSDENRRRGAATVERMAFSYSFEFHWVADLYGDGFVFPHNWQAPNKDKLLPDTRCEQLSGACAAPVEGLPSRARVGFARGKVIPAHLPPAMIKDAIGTAEFRVASAFGDPAMKSVKRGGTAKLPAPQRNAAHALRRAFAAELLILKRALAAAALLANLRTRSSPPRALCDALVSLLRGHAIASRMCLDIPVVSANVVPPLSDRDRLLLLQVTKPFCTAHHNISNVSVETIHEDAARTTTAAAVNGPLQQHLGATFIGHTLPHDVVPRVVGRRIVAPFLPLSAPLALLNTAVKATSPVLHRQLSDAATLVDTEADRVVRCFFRENIARLVGDTWRYSWQHDNGRWICYWEDEYVARKRAVRGDGEEDGGYEPGAPRTHGTYSKHGGGNEQPLEYV